MLDFAGTLVIASVIGVVFTAIVSTIGVSLGSRLTVAGIAGAWVALVAMVTAAGYLGEPLVMLMLFSLPFLAAAALVATPAAREAIMRIPAPLIIRLNAFRVLGLMFLLLAAAGRLAGPFPYSAGIGDILTGLFALSVAAMAGRSSVGNRRVMAWNAFGMLDLIAAVTLGITSAPGSPLQLIHAGVGSQAIIALPWAFVPLVLVPTYLIGHAIVFVHGREQLAVPRPLNAMRTS